MKRLVITLALLVLLLNLVSAEEASLSPVNSTVTILDEGAPKIRILSPENITYTITTIPLGYSISEPNLASIWYSINNEENTTVNKSLNIVRGDGSYHLILYANDTFGLTNFSEVHFNINESLAPSCGDGACDTGEDCDTCEEDCGICNEEELQEEITDGDITTLLPSNFKLDKTSIEISINPGKTTTRAITIENTGTLPITITKEIANFIKEFITMEEGKIFLLVGEKKTLNIGIVIPENTPPELYAGGISFTEGGIKKEVFTTIKVESEESTSLFDVKITIPEKSKITNPGEKLTSIIEIINIGTSASLEITIENIIKNSKGEIISYKNRTETITEKLNITEITDIPKKLAPGQYVFYTKVHYEDKIAIGSGNFFIKNKFPLTPLLLIIGAVILIVVGFMILYYKKTKHPRKTKIKKKVKNISKKKK